MITLPVNKLYRPIVTSNRFVASLSTPSVGYYDFEIAANTAQDIIELQPNSLYFIDGMQVSGDISQETFLDIQESPLYLYLKRKISGEIVFNNKIPIGAFCENKPLSGMLDSSKSGDYLTGTLTGKLGQNDDTIGKTSIILQISFTIYAIDESSYNREFRKG
jgi:hypothetical protein